MEKRFTKEGLDKLKKELQHLEKDVRKEVAEKLKFAASFGDLSENSAYEDAKSEQSMLETRIAKLRETIKDATVIEKNNGEEFVQIGSVIEIGTTDGKDRVLEIVGGNDSDPMKGKISCESPMGKAFLDRKVGEVCIVMTPAGRKEFKILKIK